MWGSITTRMILVGSVIRPGLCGTPGGTVKNVTVENF